MAAGGGEHLLVITSSTGYGELSYIRGVDTMTGRELWRYLAHDHGVHGSHHAPMPSPGVIQSVIKALGYARVNDQVGSVVMLRNNLGIVNDLPTEAWLYPATWGEFQFE